LHTSFFYKPETEQDRSEAMFGKFPKKRGRKKMTEKFFCDPYKKETLTGYSFSGFDVGDYVVNQSAGAIATITKVVNKNTVEIKWEITYGKI
jgi:hypothetical protein